MAGLFGAFGDPVFLLLLAALFALVVFGFLLVRRTLLGLKQGFREGKR